MAFLRQTVGRWAGLQEFGAIGFLIVICAMLALQEPEFLSFDNMKDVLVQISGIAIAAAGMTFVILSAGIDLSVGSVLALSGCAGAIAANRLVAMEFTWLSQPVIAACAGGLAAVLVGSACGLFNGVMITRLSLPPFIVTLGMMSVARGLAYVVSDNTPVEVLPAMRQIARWRPFGLPFPIFLLAGSYLISWFLLRFTLLGRYTYSIGGNEEASRLSGVRVNLCKVAVYTLSGLFSAVSGLIIAGRLAWMQPQEGDGFELDVIAAVVIGGTSLYGGSGSIFGTLLGALIMGVVRNGLNLMAVDYNVQKIVIGCIIIAAVSIDVLTKRFTVR